MEKQKMDRKQEKFKILKFGGTSLGTVERIKHVANLICNNELNLVVLSAMSGTTNSLAEIASLLFNGDIDGAQRYIKCLKIKYIEVADKLYLSAKSIEEAKKFILCSFSSLQTIAQSPISSKQEKIILAQGELLITRLMHIYLKEIGIVSVLLPAIEFMRTDRNGEPDIHFIKRNVCKLLKHYPNNRLFITQGYICRNVSGEIDNLQRGGSDYTASLLGSALNACEIQIWTDIDGLHNNDPRVVSTTAPVRTLTFDEASKLAYFGAKILHPTCILPAKLKNIPVRLLNTMNPQAPGTLISDTADTGKIKAVAAKDNVTYIKLRSHYKIPCYRFLEKIFHCFAQSHTPIDLVVTSNVEISLSIDNKIHLPKIISMLERYADVSVEDDMVIICVVGDLKWYNVGFEHQIVGALKDIPVRMISYGDNCDVSFVMRRDDKKRALEALSQRVFS